MPHFKSDFPRLNLLLTEEKTPELIAQLASGALDCALLAMPVDEPSLDYEGCFTEPFALAVAAHHRLAKRTRVKLADVKKETMLLLEEGHCLRDQALEVCSTIGIGEANHFRATSLETLRHMVAASDAVTLIPQLAVQPADRQMRYIPFADPVPSRRIGLYWRKTSARADLFHALAKTTAQHLKRIQ